MKSFGPKFLQGLTLPLPTTWLLTECMEAKGKQALWERQRPEVLKTLRQIAMVQSVESSNRIEGIVVEKSRLEPLVLGKSRPTTRPEEEIVGYRKAIRHIHEHFESLTVNPSTIRDLHRLAQEGSGDAGQLKRVDNEIIEIDSTGRRRTRFKPVAVAQTAEYFDQLCKGYVDETRKGSIPALLLTGLFVLDFLCIHPFRDGNGRVSRLLTLLLMFQNGLHVGRWISLERIVEETKEDYYEALGRSSEGWHDAKHDPLPWINYFLSTIRKSYRRFEDKVTSQHVSGGKRAVVRQLALTQVAPFSLQELHRQCPSISSQMVKLVLHDLRNEGLLTLKGRGRGARWSIKHQS